MVVAGLEVLNFTQTSEVLRTSISSGSIARGLTPERMSPFNLKLLLWQGQ